jgi:hypothetical protein
MTTLKFRAIRRDTAICAALAAAPLYRGRILRGLVAPMRHRTNITLRTRQVSSDRSH